MIRFLVRSSLAYNQEQILRWPQPVAARRKSQPDGRKGILVRATPEAWKELKRVAIDEERTLQDVMTEAINDVLKKYGEPPVA
jgi:DNA-binding protein YbaB